MGRRSWRGRPFCCSRPPSTRPQHNLETPIPITSPHNEKLKEIRKLRQRRRERDRSARFVAEGEDLLAAADAAGWPAVERFCARGSGLAGTEVEPELLSAAAGLASGTRTIAIYEERWADSPSGPLAVYLHGVADPGNVGAILRCAHAFGATCVALGPQTADPFSPKAVRASMGAIFAVPVIRVLTVAELPGVKLALDAHSDAIALADTLVAVRGEHPAKELTLLVGAERTGLPAEVLQAADRVARIPIGTESLNAAMATAVALYEVTRPPLPPTGMARGPMTRMAPP